jgi:hypothetical protein
MLVLAAFLKISMGLAWRSFAKHDGYSSYENEDFTDSACVFSHCSINRSEDIASGTSEQDVRCQYFSIPVFRL